MRYRLCLMGVLIAAVGLAAGEAAANNVVVTNAGLCDLNTAESNILVNFDISWENSWRTSTGLSNWDAGWLFVKYRPEGSNDWYHAAIDTNGYTAPGGSTITVPSDGRGAFIYRSSDGTGNVNYAGAKLRWNYGDVGLQDGDHVQICVFAIEMVYVPPGSFYLGSGGTESGSFTDGSWTNGNTIPFMITNEATLMITNAAGYLYGTSESGNNTIGPKGELLADFPKGYAAFYCMKYEISQGQWVDFFNKLADGQKSSRDITDSTGKNSDAVVNRNTVSWTNGDATCTTPDRACNYLSWMDGCAYADWAGLRPTTELEFEKVCRGPETPVADEYAWGSNNIHAVAYALDNPGLPNETVNNPGSGTGNASYSTTDGTIDGPLRCGIFAASTANPTRVEAGGSYYGVMEMSGNLCERPVTVGNSTGRGFTGTHGNGVLSPAGHATNSDWPGESGGQVTAATGTGFRGGRWNLDASYACVSVRLNAATAVADRYYNYGWRAVRSAP